MAPNKALAYFRGHRKAGSTPSSPQLNQWPSDQPSWQHQEAVPSPSVLQRADTHSPYSDSPISSAAPVLPPIPRVASTRAPQYRSARTPEEDFSQESDSRVRDDSILRTTSPSLPPIPRVASQHGDGPEKQEQATEPSNQSPQPVLAAEAPKPQEEPIPSPLKSRAPFTDFGQIVDLSQPTWTLSFASDTGYRPVTPATARLHGLDPSANQIAFRSSSPASSFSSYHKAASSVNLAADSSPASSRSAQGSTTNHPPPSNSNSGQRLSRAKMTLLNPVSLLKRRRTSQLIPEARPESTLRPLEVPAMKLPEDYDPRIKGKGVHDFNAPRPKRNYTTNDLQNMAEQAAMGVDDPSKSNRRSSTPAIAVDIPTAEFQQSPEREHIPVFVENFEEEPVQKNDSSAVQRESLANSSFLARMSKQLEFDSLVFPDSKTPQQKSPPEPPPPPHSPHHHHARSSKTDTSSYRHSSDRSTIHSSVSNDTKATSPSQSPTRGQSMASSALETPFQPQQNLKHVSSSASQASRFSFQFNSDRCVAQEKALEDKHTQKVAAKASRHVSLADSRFEELEENELDDYDDMDDGGFEEEIPLVNTDAGDASIFASGNARSRLSMPVHVVDTSVLKTSEPKTKAEPGQDVSSQRSGSDKSASQPSVATEAEQSTPKRAPTSQSSHTDDMYFDDGQIDHGSTGSVEFDEAAAFDSPVETQFGRKSVEDAVSPRKQPPAMLASLPKIATQDLSDSSRSRSSSKTPEALKMQPGKNFVHRPKASFEQLASQSDSLNAYHSALASAASKAAKDGKFERTTSIQTASSKYSSDMDEKRPSAAESEGHDPWNATPGPAQEFSALPDETEEEEDPMIAAANAEVLASDEAEFYGREFGFYGAAMAGDAQVYNGGVFERADADRSGVGHSLLREPNLTPITERSEYSTRNSFISMGGFGSAFPSSTRERENPFSAFPSSAARERENPFSSPNLKDLAANMGLNDEEMTLSQLMKLRKETFGASGGSNRSSVAAGSGSSDDSSPTSLTNSSPPGMRLFTLPSAQHPLATQTDRRPSATEQAIAEVPEAESEATSADAFRSSPPVLRPASSRRESSGAAEAFAQEYSEAVSSPVLAASKPETRPSPPRWGSPSLPSPTPGSPLRAPSSNPSPVSSPEPVALQSPAPTPALPAAQPSASSPPMPSAAMMQKFATRPMPNAYRKSWQTSQRNSFSTGPGADSVAYVQERDEEGNVRWYLERRRKKSEGEMVVVGREAVEGGRI